MTVKVNVPGKVSEASRFAFFKRSKSQKTEFGYSLVQVVCIAMCF